jgi:DNA-binding IclR family transcriptional regulator
MSPISSQPLDRVVSVLEAVCRFEAPTSIAEIAAELSLPAPTVHRLVEQLSGRGLLKRALGSKRVVIGPRLVELGASILRSAMIGDQPHAILVEVARGIVEHCQIGIVSESEVLYVDTARVDHGNGLQFNPGRRAPLHCTSIGKLFLASMSSRKFEEWLAVAELQPFTKNTITEKQALRAAVETVRNTQWAYSDEEFVPGVSGCAVPIQTRGRFTGGLGVSAPSIRFDFERAQGILPRLIVAARAIANGIAANEREPIK